ncbi:CLAVATA3/ESR (CLE)-related protein [Quillaja saponaria]|uniref:CLAVATA3/ESR (CLE)-related protein n=1 Tax=Quillaja saponaria TaxID=32244 RepID=A0AAD7QDE7_QUISA|nr:CLAVATA3/ESR (CLE)-related protein [Quillaja saponaria]
MAMIIKTHHLFSFILWLSLIFFFSFFFFEWFTFTPNHDHHQQTLRSNRKVLLATRSFDFTPFLHHRHHRHHHHQYHRHPEPAETKIDPRYGDEMRLVPTGPNPLHH